MYGFYQYIWGDTQTHIQYIRPLIFSMCIPMIPTPYFILAASHGMLQRMIPSVIFCRNGYLLEQWPVTKILGNLATKKTFGLQKNVGYCLVDLQSWWEQRKVS